MQDEAVLSIQRANLVRKALEKKDKGNSDHYDWYQQKGFREEPVSGYLWYIDGDHVWTPSNATKNPRQNDGDHELGETLASVNPKGNAAPLVTTIAEKMKDGKFGLATGASPSRSSTTPPSVGQRRFSLQAPKRHELARSNLATSFGLRLLIKAIIKR